MLRPFGPYPVQLELISGRRRMPDTRDAKTLSEAPVLTPLDQEFTIAKQVRLIRPDGLGARAVGKATEVLRRIRHRKDVGTQGALRVATTYARRIL